MLRGSHALLLVTMQLLLLCEDVTDNLCLFVFTQLSLSGALILHYLLPVLPP